MRTLTAYERDLIAGGTLTGSTDGTGGGGGGGGEPDPAQEPDIDMSTIILESLSLALPDAFAGELSMYFNDLEQTLDTGSGRPGNENSSPEQYQNYGAFDSAFTSMFGWVETLRDNPAAAYWQYLIGDVDPEFLLETITPNSISGSYRGGLASVRGGVNMQMQDDSHAIFNINGQIIYGTYYRVGATGTGGSTSGGNPDDIVVTARSEHGYWVVNTSPMLGFSSNTPLPHAAGGTYVGGPSPTLPAAWSGVVDGKADKVAASIAAKIKAKSDWDRFEYSAIIWIDKNGVMHESMIIRGTQTDTGPTKLATDYGVPNGAKMVAFVHNHPYFFPAHGTTPEGPNPLRMYVDNSDLAGLKIWAPAAGYVHNGVNMSRTYIVHDGGTDKYNYVQNSGPIPPAPIIPLPSAPKGTFNPGP